MKKYLDKNISLILKIFLYINPILDLITSIMINYLNINFTIGMIIRFMFLLFILIYYIFIKRNIDKKSIILLVIGIIYTCIYSGITIIYKGYNPLLYELEWLLKTMYFILLILLIDRLDVKITIDDFINISLIYLMLIAIPNIFNISLNSYSQGKVGSVGLFNSGNEISAILSILNPIIIYYLFNDKNNIKRLILSILMLYTYFTMGSKIIIISLIVSIIYNLIIYLKKKKINKNKIYKGIIPLILLIVIIGIILPKTNFYYNIKLHLNYLEINNVSDVMSYKFLDRFIFSDRLTYLNDTYNIYMNSNIFNKLFGIGFIINYATDNISMKVIEMDFFDILFRFGIIFFIIYINILFIYIKNVKDKLLLFSIYLGLIIALLVGHTLIAPSVSIILAYMIKCDKVMK